MLTIKNNLNSPQTIYTTRGPVILAPMGEMEAEGISPAYDLLYRSSPFLSVTEGKAAAKPAAEPGDDLQRLRAEYKDLTGKDADGRWKADRVQSEIDKALAS